MKHLVFLSICAITLLVGSLEALFLGPAAVGLAVGAVLLAKGFIVGTLIAGRRSNRYARSSRYSYSPSSHYTKPNYHYTQPDSYYYSSTNNHYGHGRRKRSVPAVDMQELHRLRREAETFDFDKWVLELSSKDQDDCGKRLICELNAGNKDTMTTEEIILAKAFSSELDITKGQVEMSLAAEIGRTLGKGRCKELYKRCDTPVVDMLAMIQNELDEMNIIQQEINGLTEAEIQASILEEKREIEEKVKEAGKKSDSVWD